MLSRILIFCADTLQTTDIPVRISALVPIKILVFETIAFPLSREYRPTLSDLFDWNRGPVHQVILRCKVPIMLMNSPTSRGDITGRTNQKNSRIKLSENNPYKPINVDNAINERRRQSIGNQMLES
jgi:hypothetical protein